MDPRQSTSSPGPKPERSAQVAESLLRTAVRHRVAVAGDISQFEAARIGGIFLNANEEGCCYDVVEVPGRSDALPVRPPGTTWHAIIIPPLERWLGISPVSARTRWVRAMVESSDHVIAVGTGGFLLAAAGSLDGRDVVAGPDYANQLAAVAPGARVHCGISAVRDGRICTAVAGTSAISLCMAIIADDYGVEIQRRLVARPAA